MLVAGTGRQELQQGASGISLMARTTQALMMAVHSRCRGSNDKL